MDTKIRFMISALLLSIVISLTGTIVVLTKLKSIPSGISGMANTDTGQVQIQIAELLSIDVYENTSINFGTCVPPKSTDAWADYATVSSHQAENASHINCTGSDMQTSGDNYKHLSLLNVGNVNANITVESDVSATSILTSSNAKLYLEIENGTTGSGCNDIRVGMDDSTLDTFREVPVTPSTIVLCENLDSDASQPRISIYANFTVPWDSKTGGTLQLTFSGAST